MGMMGHAGWSPSALGAAFMLDPAYFTLSGSNITAAMSGDGSGKTLTATAGKEPVLDTGGAFGVTRPCLRTSNPSTRLFSATGGVTGNQPWSMFTIAEWVSGGAGPASLGCFSLLGTPAATKNMGIGANATTFVMVGNGNGITLINGFNPPLDTVPHIVEAKYDGTNLYTYFDGKLLGGPTALALNITDAALGFGSWFTQPTYPTIDARVHSQAFVCGSNPSQANVTQFIRYELRRLSSAAGKGRMVSMFGDSTTEGTASGAEPLDKSLRLQQVYPNVIFPANFGVSGETASSIADRFLTFTGPCTHVVMWCGRNMPPRTTFAADAATTYASIVTTVQRAHAFGARIVVGTLDQWGASTVGSYENNYRLALNTLILANTAGADAIALISEAMGAYNAANFCADTLHENQAAQRAIVAPAIYTALLAC